METTLSILQNIHMALYIAVFVLSVYKYSIYKNTPLRLLPYILLFTLVTESLGLLIKEVFLGVNFIVYNIYYLLYFSFFFYVFMKTIEEKKFQRYIKIGAWLFLLFFLRDLIITGIFNQSFTITYIFGALTLIFCIILYYISILQSSLVLVIKNDLLFWVSVGLFLFYIGYLPIKIIRTWFLYNLGGFFEILVVIQYSLNLIMYMFFLLGFLWMKKRS